MTDIAALGFAISSAPLKDAADEMQRMSGAARVAEQASNGLTGAARSTAGASKIAADALDGQTASLTRLTAAANSNERAIIGIGSAARNTSARIAQLSFQINDVATMLAMGASPFQVLASQGGQVVQIYQGQGGVRTALADVAGILRTVATRFAPIAAAAGLGAAAIREMQKEVETLTGRSVTFGETFKAAIGVVVDDIKGLLQPAVEAIWPTVSYVFDKLSRAAIDIAEMVINSFRMAFEDVKFIWNQFPNMIGAAVTGGVNAVITGIATMIERTSDYIDSWIDTINDKLGTLGVNIPKIGWDVGSNPLPNPYLDDLLKNNEEHEREQRERSASHPLRDYFGDVTRRAADRLAGPQLPDGAGNGKIPIPTFRGIDDQPGELTFYQDLQKASQRRTRDLEAERNALGLTGAAAESFSFQQKAINDALSQNIQLSPEMIAGIKQMGDAYGAAAQKLKEAKLQNDLQFERDQLSRSDIDARVADRLRGAGQPIDFGSDLAQMIRMNELLADQKAAWEDIRDTGKGAIAQIVGSAVTGFKNIDDVLQNIAGNMAQQLAELAITNPINNAIYGGNAPTLEGLGGLGGIWSALTGGAMPAPAGMPGMQNVGAMNVQAAMVTINGAGVGAGIGGPLGALERMVNPANSNLGSAPLGGVSSAGSAVDLASGLLGFNETGNRSQINSFLKAGGVDLDAAMQKWCAAFVNSSLAQIGVDGTGSNVATSFLNWGQKIDPSSVLRGDVLVKANGRGAGQVGGHVGFATGATRMQEGSLQLEMLSGNSSNKVAKDWYDANALAVRRSTETLGALSRSAGGTAESLGTLGTGFDAFGKNLMNAFPAAPSGGGGGFGGLLSSLFGGGGGLNPAFSGSGAYSWLSANPGGYIGLYADGTESAPPGWAWVGEEGPELMKMRGGETVRSNQRSRQMMDEMRQGFSRPVTGASHQSGGPTGRSVQFTQNIHNYAGVEVREERTEDGEGNIRSDVFLDRMFAAAASRPGSATDKALAARGAKRRAIRR